MPLEAGHYRFDLIVKSDCYLGLDVVQKVRPYASPLPCVYV